MKLKNLQLVNSLILNNKILNIGKIWKSLWRKISTSNKLVVIVTNYRLQRILSDEINDVKISSRSAWTFGKLARNQAELRSWNCGAEIICEIEVICARESETPSTTTNRNFGCTKQYYYRTEASKGKIWLIRWLSESKIYLKEFGNLGLWRFRIAKL